MKVSILRDLLMEVWQKHLAQIATDPSDAYKSGPTRHIKWAKALQRGNFIS
jgi:hypothetical protein